MTLRPGQGDRPVRKRLNLLYRKTDKALKLTILWEWWMPVMALWVPSPCGKAEERYFGEQSKLHC
jgi:hypothetical protein